MPNYLKEADWKTELDKKLNVGLKVMKTGISEKLRLYESAMNAYNSNKTKSNAETALKAVQGLIGTAKEQAKKHTLFKDATAYMNQIVIEAGKVEMILVPAIALFGLLDLVKTSVKEGEEKLSSIDTLAKLTDMNTGTLLQKVRGAGAACDKIPALKKYAQQSKDLTETSVLTALNDKTWKDHKAKVETFLKNVKADAAKVV